MSAVDAIRVSGVRKAFRRSRVPWQRGVVLAVDGVDLSLAPGTVLGLVGPNGAGKTTLMRLVLGLLQPTEGEVELLGERHGTFGSPVLRRVGALIEEPRFVPFLTGRENLVQTARLLGIEDITAEVTRALADVGIAERGDDAVRTYSMGMRQRLGLARCLLGTPDLLVLDEPTNGLDPAGIAETRRLVRRYATEHQVGVLMSSHLLDGVESTCDEVAFMDRGRIVHHEAISSIEERGESLQALYERTIADGPHVRWGE